MDGFPQQWSAGQEDAELSQPSSDLSGANTNPIISSDGSNEAKLSGLSMFDPRVRDTVQTSTRNVVKATIGLVVIFPMMLCLFFGVGWSPKDNYKGVRVAIIDFDGDIIGREIANAANNPNFPLTAVFVSDAVDLNDVRRRVNLGEFNGALVANANASAMLRAALRSPAAHYVPAGAASFVFDEGRGGSSMATILRCAAVLASDRAAIALTRRAQEPARAARDRRRQRRRRPGARPVARGRGGDGPRRQPARAHLAGGLRGDQPAPDTHLRHEHGHRPRCVRAPGPADPRPPPPST